MRCSLPKYVERKSVKGNVYYYFRKNGQRLRLPDDPDSEEFSKAYWNIRNGKTSKTNDRTWNALIIEYYKQPRFKNKSNGTRANYRRHCEDIRKKNGDKKVSSFKRKHALAVQTAMQDTWSKANERLAVLSILCKLAVDLEWIDRNPVVDIPKLKGGSYKAWPDETLAAFEAHCIESQNTTARTIYELCIGTGQRIGDCVSMRWDDFDGQYMKVLQEKTRQPLEVYCPERLRTYLSSLKKQGTHILPRNLTQPIGKRAAQKAVEKVRLAIGVMHGEGRLVIHGWRYTAAKHLAEAGCSDAEIQAVTGHQTVTMVQKYRTQANQRAAAKRAQQMREQNTNRT